MLGPLLALLLSRSQPRRSSRLFRALPGLQQPKGSLENILSFPSRHLSFVNQGVDAQGGLQSF